MSIRIIIIILFSVAWTCREGYLVLRDKNNSKGTTTIDMSAPIETRMKRIRQREYKKHGYRIRKDGDMYEQHLKFLDFARSRNLLNIDRWAETLTCLIIHVDGTNDYRKTAADIANRFYNR